MTADVENLTRERSAIYGHPVDVYRRMDLINRAVEDCKDTSTRIGLQMIGMKMVRLVETPDHADTLDDIDGYVETIRMAHREQKRREGESR